ncbi:MAG: SMI1/KNR4 family protein [Nostoc sp.]|uniref:SMI1/KNR4 family protein n=1 Tax=Nostoc sp. TaxID=1180 RepID=UPI002FF98C7B
MQEIWTRIEFWLKTNTPQVLDTLNPGASESQIEAVEEALLIQFPDDVKSSYRIHNGQSGYNYGLINGREFLSLERIQKEWQVWKELLDAGNFDGCESQPEPGIGICTDWWSALWIPLTYDGDGNHDCVDLAPAKGGKVGQIIQMWHDNDIRELVASSFQNWLEEYATGLESGQYVFSHEYGGIVKADSIWCL